MLFNCSNHASILAALPRLRLAAPAGVTIGAYANGFRTVQASGGGEGDVTAGAAEYDNITPEAYAQHAQAWNREGASIIGGCCGVFPEHILQVTRALNGRPPCEL